MARNQHAGPSTLRNRNRVTNKTRLKVIKESIDADPIVLDEDEEKARVVSTAGVDAEDANEHHLQAVLSAAATRHHSFTRSTRGAEKESAPAAYIPTPDSTGLVDNYEELYPPNRWRDPVTYVKSSDSVEEATSFALANGFIYYMDERDKEWLDKNNEDRGEGSSKRPSRKGKEPESVTISEDEFELVMAMFEKITHEKAEFLHHNFQDVPSFSLYEETFASPLPPTTFALFQVPTWIPVPAQLTRIARVIYSHWGARRTERNGHPIIPVVNLDESDTKNESYICFRRRESKAVRKTRAQQATYSDKMIRLQSELSTAMNLAKDVLSRELLKRQVAIEGKGMWERRFVLVDMKRKFPTLGTKEDEELFQDRERVPKKIKTDAPGRLPIKLRTPREGGEYGTPVAAEPIMKPKDRVAMIQAQIEEEMLKRKDHRWEDVADNPYQQLPQPFSAKHFKYVASSRGPDSATTPERNRACRLRYGRGGRRHLDRRLSGMRHVPPRTYEPSGSDSDDSSDLERRWRYDADDEPPIGPDGPEEHDRVLIDDFSSQYLMHSSTLLTEEDQHALIPDATMNITGPDGRTQQVVSIRQLPLLHVVSRQRGPVPANMLTSHSGTPTPQTPASASGASAHQPRASMAPPSAVPPPHALPNGIMRPPSTPTAPTLPANPSPAQPPASVASSNGSVERTNIDQEVRPSVTATASPAVQPQPEASQSESQAIVAPSTSPVRPKVPTPTMTAIPNGFTIPAVSTYPAHMANGASYAARPNGYNPQLLKSAFASLAQGGDTSMNGTHMTLRSPANSYSVPPGAYTAQLAAARQMHWLASQQQRPPSVNIVDSNGMDAGLANSLSPPISGPQRVPSANGSRSMPISRGVTSPALAQAMAAGQGRSSPANAHAARVPQHSPTLLSPGLVSAQAQQSPPRPQPPMPSPSMQARQIVGSSGF